MKTIDKMTITQIKEYLAACDELSTEAEGQILADGRTGVRLAYQTYCRRRGKILYLQKMWDEMSVNEGSLWAEGYQWIAGVDEVGRGPLAGPVVTAAVILPQDLYLPGLNDSKKLSASLREKLYEEIMEKAVAVSIEMGSAQLIDDINIYQATLRTMEKSVNALPIQPDITLNDAVTIPGITMPQRPIIGGDGKSISIAAASVVAKVTRDRLMMEYDKQYPGYGFSTNMGYGTEEHLNQLRKQGPCPIHRRSFAGVLTTT